MSYQQRTKYVDEMSQGFSSQEESTENNYVLMIHFLILECNAEEPEEEVLQ